MRFLSTAVLSLGLLLSVSACDTSTTPATALQKGSVVALATPDGPELTATTAHVEALYAHSFTVLRGEAVPSLERAYVEDFPDGSSLLVMVGEESREGTCTTVSARLIQSEGGAYSLGGEGYTCRNLGWCDGGDCIPTTDPGGGATCGCDNSGVIEYLMPDNGCEMESGILLEG
ncbi:MAG: hypothetical protein AAGI52_18140 [Bacteroidota bacterium]